MKLLIVTQTVDTEDPVLGFFVRWIEELSKRVEHVEVICLKSGKFNLPENVRVHSLGKENPPRFARRLRYVIRFKWLAWRLRRDYDAVFVHMNEEYVLLAGPLWKLLGKRVVLWRNHKKGTWRTRLAAALADAVCYTSPDAYVAPLPRAARMPIGIDTNLFKPSAEQSERNTILFLGRLDLVKKPELFVAALKKLADEGVHFHADIYGDPTDSRAPHVAALRESAATLVESGTLVFHPGVAHAETSAIYRAHAIYANLTPSGSFDKTIGEAMASGCIVVAVNSAVRGVLPDSLLVDLDSVESVVHGLRSALHLPDNERSELIVRQYKYIREHHSLELLASKITSILTS